MDIKEAYDITRPYLKEGILTHPTTGVEYSNTNPRRRRVYITSKGTVEYEEYLLAQDILENTKRIKKRDIVETHTYLSSKGKKYIYLGKFKYKKKTAIEIKRMNYLEYDKYRYGQKLEFNYLLDVEHDRLVKLSSVKLIEDLGRINFDTYTLARMYLSVNDIVDINYK